jgi:hypothetical protein
LFSFYKNFQKQELIDFCSKWRDFSYFTAALCLVKSRSSQIL